MKPRPKRYKPRTKPKLTNPSYKQKYAEYLASERWIEFRKRIINKRGPFCEVCGSLGKVQLHHLTYERVGKEQESDVKLLCEGCHQAAHKIKIVRFVGSSGIVDNGSKVCESEGVS